MARRTLPRRRRERRPPFQDHWTERLRLDLQRQCPCGRAGDECERRGSSRRNPRGRRPGDVKAIAAGGARLAVDQEQFCAIALLPKTPTRLLTSQRAGLTWLTGGGRWTASATRQIRPPIVFHRRRLPFIHQRDVQIDRPQPISVEAFVGIFFDNLAQSQRVALSDILIASAAFSFDQKQGQATPP